MHIQIIDTLNKTKLQKLYRITEKKKNEKELKKDSDEQNEESAE